MDSLWSTILEYINSNQFLAGGAALGILGISLNYGRHVVVWSFERLRLRFVSQVEIRGQREQSLFGLWLARNKYGNRRRTIATLKGGRSTEEEGDKPTPVHFEPGFGFHLMRYGGHFLLLNRDRENSSPEGMMGQSSSFFRDVYRISLLGGNPNAAMDFVSVALSDSEMWLRKTASAYINSMYGDSWRIIRSGTHRPVSSIVLREGVSEEIVGCISEFLELESWYLETGVPYRLGFLLYGPPGTGKSSFVRAVANDLHLPLYVLDISTNMNDAKLLGLLSEVPNGSVVLLEDLDASLLDRNGKDGERVTLSGLLNSLDGAVSPEGRILFITTNHLEKLDERILRPGRVDYKYFFGNCDKDQVARLFLRFFPGMDSLADEFSDLVMRNYKDVPPVAVQSWLIRNRNAPVLAASEFSM